ncbi:MAG: hypothetical protein II375_00590 [Bacteroidales bacterium]|nr:hypothetical protein [Bacteroidales bacterium]
MTSDTSVATTPTYSHATIPNNAGMTAAANAGGIWIRVSLSISPDNRNAAITGTPKPTKPTHLLTPMPIAAAMVMTHRQANLLTRQTLLSITKRPMANAPTSGKRSKSCPTTCHAASIAATTAVAKQPRTTSGLTMGLERKNW